MKSQMDTYKLSNGVTIPCLGFGTWQTPDGETAVQSVRCAIDAGYTHIDTAQAYGNEKEKQEEKKEEQSEDNSEDNLLVDLSDEKEKPEVKQVTVGDAMEYFQDLGLEYNVDYVDASNKGNSSNTKEEATEAKQEEDSTPIELPVVVEDNKDITPIEVKNEANDEVLDDDNLFDLIDSMYKDS